jgi:hypothetical protein
LSTALQPAQAQGDARAVRVEVVFHVADEIQAHTVAAKMVDRAHEIANLPECECDLDVSVERTPSDALASAVERKNTP